jgi:hypothetical protein
MKTVTISQGDTRPILEADLTWLDGTAVNLTAATVKCVLRAAGDPTWTFIRDVALPESGNHVEYQLVEEDVARAGKFFQRWEVTFSGGAMQSFPNGEYNVLVITGALSLSQTLLFNPYCTVGDLVSELKAKPESVTPGSDLEKDLEMAINNASRWVDEHTGREYFTRDNWEEPLLLDMGDSVYAQAIYPKLGGKFLRIRTLRDFGLNGETLVAGTDFSLKDDVFRRYGIGNYFSLLSTDAYGIRAEFGYDQMVLDAEVRTVDHTMVPRELPTHIRFATRLVAAAFSGQNRKEVAGLDGQKQEILTNAIPATVYQLLGKAGPLLM